MLVYDRLLLLILYFPFCLCDCKTIFYDTKFFFIADKCEFCLVELVHVYLIASVEVF